MLAKIVLPLFLCVNAFSQSAACGPTPVRPLGAPSGSQPQCVCTSTSCYYQWSAAPQSAPRQPLIDSSIPGQVRSADITNPIDLMIAVERLRRLRQLRLQNQALAVQPTQPQPVQQPAPAVQNIQQVQPSKDAPPEGPLKTHERLNGRLWMSLTDASRKAFLLAYKEGLISVALHDDKGDKEAFLEKMNLFWPDESIEFVAIDMDRFFAIKSNLAIPIEGALILLSLRHAGIAEDIISELNVDYREAANQ